MSAKKRATEHTTGFERTSIAIPEGATVFKLDKAGTRRIDIIPYTAGKGNPYADEGELHFERTYFSHRGVGVGGDTYICPRKSAGKKCPICDHRAALTGDPEADDDLVKSLNPKERQLWNVIDLDDRSKGVQLWDISFHLFGKLLDSRVRNEDEDDKFSMFADLDEGMTLKLTVEEKSFGGNTFYEVSAIDFKNRKQPYEESILEEAHDLDSLLKVLAYDDLKSIFLQVDDGDKKSSKKNDDEDDDDDNDPPKKPAKKATKKAPVEENDDEDDDDEDEPPKKPAKKATKKAPVEENDDDDDDEDEPPKKTAKKVTKKAPVEENDDDDDDDDDDDEDDEDEPPKKPAKKKAPVEENDDEDDEDEPPKKPAKKKAPVEDDWEDDEVPFDDDDEAEEEPKKKAPAKRSK